MPLGHYDGPRAPEYLSPASVGDGEREAAPLRGPCKKIGGRHYDLLKVTTTAGKPRTLSNLPLLETGPRRRLEPARVALRRTESSSVQGAFQLVSEP